MKTPAYKEGWTAFQDGHSIARNPYRKLKTSEPWDWQFGWMDAHAELTRDERDRRCNEISGLEY